MAKQKRSGTVLDQEAFPIVGWAGLSGPMLREKTLRDMRAAGFTVNMGGDDERDPVQLLDIAHKAGMQLLFQHKCLHVSDGQKLDDARRAEIRKLVRRIKDHPGLFMYSLRDEPWLPSLPLVAEVADIVREIDTYHCCYVNHFPPFGGWDAPTIEEFHRAARAQLKTEFLSYDHYAICVATQDELQAMAGKPWAFPQAHLRVKEDFYQCLDLFRRMSVDQGLPFWAFTNAVRHGYYPPATEGHIRFQLMSALAYGARGLQYFTYAYDGCMVRADGSTTETWELARKVNSDIHVMAAVLRQLRSIGVYHSGPLWPMTQLPPGDLLEVRGDPCMIGVFQDDGGMLYLMVVSKNPCDWSLVHIKMRKPLPIFELDVRDGCWAKPYPRQPDCQPLTLAPGEGRLIRIGGEGKSRF